MKLFNFVYDDNLEQKLSQFKDSKHILIHIFDGFCDEANANKIIAEIMDILPQSEILLASSSVQVHDGEVCLKNIIIAIAVFQKTTIKTMSFKANNNNEIANSITASITPQTKAIIMLNNISKLNPNEILNDIAQNAPEIVIVGGNASDDLSLSKIFVGDKFGTRDLSLVCAFLESSDLQVYTNHVFEWEGVGLPMTVTKSNGNIVETINGVSPRDIYRRYLGQEAVENLSSSGYEFPIIFEYDKMIVARSPIAILDDGSIKYAGEVPEGAKVRLSVGSLTKTKNKINSIIEELQKEKFEGIFMYSCIARYIYFKDTILDYEIARFNNIAPTCGFFSYGEFYHCCSKNYILNSTNTFIALSENCDELAHRTIREIDFATLYSDTAIHSLSHLNKASNDDYNQMLAIFKQYKELLEKSSTLLYLDKSGKIMNANENFLRACKYQKNEIVGKNFANIILKESGINYEHTIEEINKFGIWSGVLKIKTQDSTPFIARTLIKPLINTDGKILMYICTMDDVTKYEVNENKLQSSIEEVININIQKEQIIKQYQDLLNKSTAVVRIRGEIFIEANKTCDEIFGFKSGGMIGRHIGEVLEKNESVPTDAMVQSLRAALAMNGYVSTYLPCVRSDGEKIHLQAYLLAINVRTKFFKDEEVIGILHDITNIFEMQSELEKVQKEVLCTIGSISEGRSRETGNHIRRVAEFTYLLAKLYGLSEEESELMRIASPMHDIGKLAIPDMILNKPGKLTDEEFGVMKTHSLKGYEMLQASNLEIMQISAKIALTHHEWWNGNGYPNKLSGEDIPLCGRIVAVADVFDALSHDRCYKKAWSIDEVVEHFKKNKGVQFDAKIVNLLLDNLPKFLEIKEKYKDVFGDK